MEYEEKYEVLDELGRGSFGVVNKCRNKKDGRLVAAKFVRKTEKSKKEAENEVYIMGKFDHEQLIKLYDAFETRRQLIIVMELVSGKELFEKCVEENVQLTEQQVVRYTRQILEGVKHMHEHNIVHLDLKPENILCVSHPTDETKDVIKLIDFGLSKELKPGENQSAICGTAEFIAPEIINFEPISLKTDMWSVGVVTYVLLSGLSPFLGHDDNETYQNVTSGEYDYDGDEDDEENIFDTISQQAKDFIDACLIYKQSKRMTIDEALAHSWINEWHVESVLDNKEHLKSFLSRRRWQRVMNTVKAVGRFSSVLRSLEGVNGNKGGTSKMSNLVGLLGGKSTIREDKHDVIEEREKNDVEGVQESNNKNNGVNNENVKTSNQQNADNSNKNDASANESSESYVEKNDLNEKNVNANKSEDKIVDANETNNKNAEPKEPIENVEEKKDVTNTHCNGEIDANDPIKDLSTEEESQKAKNNENTNDQKIKSEVLVGIESDNNKKESSAEAKDENMDLNAKISDTTDIVAKDIKDSVDTTEKKTKKVLKTKKPKETPKSKTNIKKSDDTTKMEQPVEPVKCESEITKVENKIGTKKIENEDKKKVLRTKKKAVDVPPKKSNRNSIIQPDLSPDLPESKAEASNVVKGNDVVKDAESLKDNPNIIKTKPKTKRKEETVNAEDNTLEQNDTDGNKKEKEGKPKTVLKTKPKPQKKLENTKNESSVPNDNGEKENESPVEKEPAKKKVLKTKPKKPIKTPQPKKPIKAPESSVNPQTSEGESKKEDCNEPENPPDKPSDETTPISDGVPNETSIDKKEVKKEPLRKPREVPEDRKAKRVNTSSVLGAKETLDQNSNVVDQKKASFRERRKPASMKDKIAMFQ